MTNIMELVDMLEADKNGEEKAGFLVDLLDLFRNGSSKGDLMEFVEKNSNVDSALPQMAVKKLQEYGIDLRNYYVLDYQGERRGQLLNLAEHLVNRMSKTLKI